MVPDVNCLEASVLTGNDAVRAVDVNVETVVAKADRVPEIAAEAKVEAPADKVP